MSWPENPREGGAPSVELIVRRLAYHIHQRTLEPETAARVALTARITRKTLARYATYRPAAATGAGDLHAPGPRRLDLYAAICLALGENPGKVLWAATVAGDYPSMLAVLSADVHLQHRLVISDPAAGPDTATLTIVPARQAA